MPSCEGLELLLVTVDVELAGDGGGDEGRAVFAEEGDGGGDPRYGLRCRCGMPFKFLHDFDLLGYRRT